MKIKSIRNVVVGLVALSIIIPGASALAWKGKNSGYHHGQMSNLSDEQVEEFNTLQKEFYEETKDIRQSMRESRLELQLVMTKNPVDVKTAKKIQKEISDLKAKMAEKRIDYLAKVKEIDPDLGRMGFMGKGHGRKGYGQGYMTGGDMRGGCGNF